MTADPHLRIIGELQDLLLERLLAGRPLPGQEHPLGFPDLAYLTSGEATYVAAEHYHGHLAVATVRPESELRTEAGGATGYARFQPTDPESRPITLRLQVVVPFPDVEPLPVGEVIASFEPATGSRAWTTVAPTHVVAI